MSVTVETLVENVFYCEECDCYVSESEIKCDHTLIESEYVDIF